VRERESVCVCVCVCVCDEEPREQMVLTIAVLCLFVIELLLRIVAQRRRFFWNVWNLFDLVVIFGSVIIAISK
jgi:hypothetical protein